MRPDGNYILFMTCEHGRLEVARWLQQTFHLTVADARAEDNWVLRTACEYGHIEYVRWLHQTFQFDVSDVRATDNQALRWACKGGHLEVARWLQQTFRLTAADARSKDNTILRRACGVGNLEVLRWLQRTWGIPPDVLAVAGSPDTACAAYLRGLRSLHGQRMLCWSPRTHADFPLTARCFVLHLLLVYQRLARGSGELPYLPPELWLHLLSYLPAW